MSKVKIETVYGRIGRKFEDGTFTSGRKCSLTKYHIQDDIYDIPEEDRTPEVCCSVIDYGRFSLVAVPEESMTREFFINAFTNDEVFAYIKGNIDKFDRDFFKDLIVTNKYATMFSNNCFEIMPVEYIDEEMCSLGILNATGWTHSSWFYSTLRRKPEALTADIWKMGARFYSRMSGDKNEFLEITPEEYKDEEYYREMCGCNYNAGMALTDNKGKIMNSIPQEVITPEFVLLLLSMDDTNVARFNEKAFETVISYEKDGKNVEEKVWQFIVKADGSLIRYMGLNDERVEFFLNLYDKDTFEYRFGFKDNYKQYKKMQEEKDAQSRAAKRNQENIIGSANRVFYDGLLYAMEGEDPTRAIDNEISRGIRNDTDFLPIEYKGLVPDEYRRVYDTEEYLLAVCNSVGIKILEEYDRLLYRVELPEDWSICHHDRYWYDIKDNAGNKIIRYFYDPTFYDRKAYVSEINATLGMQDGSGNKVFTKSTNRNVTD